jgi:hypothetical protein
MPGVPPLDLSGTGTIGKPLPCPGDQRRQCIEIAESTTLSPFALKALMTAMADKVGADVANIAKRTDPKRLALRWRLVTEPATLLPHYLLAQGDIGIRCARAPLR